MPAEIDLGGGGALRCRKAVPFCRLGIVARDLAALEIHETKSALGDQQALLGGARIPFDRFGKVLRHAASLAVEAGEIMLRLGRSLFGKLAQDRNRGLIIAALKRGIDIASRAGTQRQRQSGGQQQGGHYIEYGFHLPSLASLMISRASIKPYGGGENRAQRRRNSGVGADAGLLAGPEYDEVG